MRVTVFGAAGDVESRMAAGALARVDQVTAVVRDLLRTPTTTKGE